MLWLEESVLHVKRNKLVLVMPAFSASAAGIGLVFAGAQHAPNQGRYVSLR
jgi:hypothetical protein